MLKKKCNIDPILLTISWGKFQLGWKTSAIKKWNKIEESIWNLCRATILNTENIEVVIREKMAIFINIKWKQNMVKIYQISRNATEQGKCDKHN